MVRDHDGNITDPFGGRDDLERGILRFVGAPANRIQEDGLRVLRAFRFAVTKGFVMAPETRAAVDSPLAAVMLSKVSIERIREEVEKMFAHTTFGSLCMFETMTDQVKCAIFRDGLRLSATLRKN